ncbi:MAG: 50S ribosomal protein L18 [Patescibacteria group bacterium]|nr:MAG: 50S ribosomal protein L18 [Patescibacteria group bacterium]
MKRIVEHFDRKIRRKIRNRSKVNRTLNGRVRVSIFRSNKYIYAQAIDAEGKVVASYDSLRLQKESDKKQTKVEQSFQVGKKLAEMLSKKNIKEVVFDRGQYKFHGRVKAVAEGLRQGKIKV